ncbi:MAG: class I SAM-dependent methyltransferase [Patescibacteria group bacterium]
MEKIRIEAGETIPEVVKDTRLSPQFEARYKLANRLLKESGITQILEIAAGLSPRGLELSEDSRVTYVETDFSKLIEEKKQILSKFKKELPANIYFEPADALVYEELLLACKHFDEKKPIAVIHEGLLRYLSFEQKAVVAKNIHKILEKFGGVWITPDISKKRMVQDSEVVAHGLRDKINEITGINIDNNLFDNEEHAVRFFSDLGFSIERHSFMEERNNLVSPKKLNIDDHKVRLLLENAQVFVMRVKT